MALRDAERFKEKIEVSLDSRQIFFLFFGGAVIACLVFVLGVMVGKRLNERERVARKATTSAAVDPLAALDELAADEQRDDLAFPVALGRDRAERPLGAADVAPAAPPPEKAEKQEKAQEKAPEKVQDKAPQNAQEKAPDPTEKVADKGETKDRTEAKRRGRFCLQLSSFQDKTEADAFVAKLKADGYQPRVTQSEVEDKGIFWRVRVGEYGSHDEALEAKKDFEKRHHIIAYVTKL